MCVVGMRGRQQGTAQLVCSCSICRQVARVWTQNGEWMLESEESERLEKKERLCWENFMENVQNQDGIGDRGEQPRLKARRNNASSRRRLNRG